MFIGALIKKQAGKQAVTEMEDMMHHAFEIEKQEGGWFYQREHMAQYARMHGHQPRKIVHICYLLSL